MDIFPSNKNFKVLGIDREIKDLQFLNAFELGNNQMVTAIVCDCQTEKQLREFESLVDFYI